MRLLAENLHDRFADDFFWGETETLGVSSVYEPVALVSAALREHHRSRIRDDANLCFLGAKDILRALAFEKLSQLLADVLDHLQKVFVRFPHLTAKTFDHANGIVTQSDRKTEPRMQSFRCC